MEIIDNPSLDYSMRQYRHESSYVCVKLMPLANEPGKIRYLLTAQLAEADGTLIGTAAVKKQFAFTLGQIAVNVPHRASAAPTGADGTLHINEGQLFEEMNGILEPRGPIDDAAPDAEAELINALDHAARPMVTRAIEAQERLNVADEFNLRLMGGLA